MTRFITLFIAVLYFRAAIAAAPSIPDYPVKLYHGSKQTSLWALEIAPPPGHHFNLEAPHSAQVEQFSLDAVQESFNSIIFQGVNPALHSGATIEVSAFVCDEKKTYCIKKKMFVTLEDKNARPITEKFTAKKAAKVISIPEQKKPETKNGELFIENQAAKAIAEVKATQKPILIDFYGIWCPPCNLYNETIFGTNEFAEQAKKFVLLKMDADDEKSFELKSKFKIGGYPTFLIAKMNAQGELEEVERIVGYYPPQEFYARLNDAYTHRNDPLEQRWKGRATEYLSALLEQKKFDEMIKFSEKSHEAKILLYRWIAEVKKSEDFLKNEKNLAEVKKTIDQLVKTAIAQKSDTLIHLVDFLNSEFWLKQSHYAKMAEGLMDQLANRVDPNTLFIKGSEFTLPDLDAMRMDLAETMSDNSKVSEIRKQAISHYEKLIKIFTGQGKKDLRSLNLEYAFLLWKDGRVDDAKKLYQQFITKYPAEFTFYYAASKMYLTLNDLPKAREMAEKALQYSYGDNRIRAMDRLVNIMGEQGLKAEAIAKANQFLKDVKVPEGLDVRTGRYVDALKKTVALLEKKDGAKK